MDPGPEAQFLAFLAQGRFMIQRSAASGRAVFPPRVAEPGRGAPLDWIEASGRGIVYSTTIVRPRPPAAPYNVALIELEEGPRMMSRVEGIEPEAVRIGVPVQAGIAQGEDGPFVVFRVASA